MAKQDEDTHGAYRNTRNGRAREQRWSNHDDMREGEPEASWRSTREYERQRGGSADDRYHRERDDGRDRWWHDRDRGHDERPWSERGSSTTGGDRGWTQVERGVYGRAYDRSWPERDDPQRDFARGERMNYTSGEPARARGPHAGKGPVGYQRSDERIRELVCEALTDHDEIDASMVEVNVERGEVTLSGTIEDRRMKRLAEQTVEGIYGVRDIHNQLRIDDHRH